MHHLFCKAENRKHRCPKWYTKYTTVAILLSLAYALESETQYYDPVIKINIDDKLLLWALSLF